MNKEIHERLFKDLSAQVNRTLRRAEMVPELLRKAEEVEALLTTCKMFGFNFGKLSVDFDRASTTLRDAGSCSGLLPVLELFDQAGYICGHTSDWVDMKNRDYHLHKDNFNLRLEVYFGKGSCRKVAIPSTEPQLPAEPKYRLECGVDDADKTNETETPDDDIPF